MRRLTPRYQRWLKRRARNEARRRGVRFTWRTAVFATQTGIRLARVLPKDKLPPVLCLDKQYEQTIGFIQNFRVRTNNCLDFSSCSTFGSRGLKIPSMDFTSSR
jgi:hypothetical protein